jgi:hypothetical protein
LPALGPAERGGKESGRRQIVVSDASSAASPTRWPFYQTYLRNAPRAPNRGELEKRIAELERKRVARDAP